MSAARQADAIPLISIHKPSMPSLKAITFDLWDTIVADDSDEPKRAAQGLRSKRDERRHLIWDALNAQTTIDKATVELAYDVADAAFNFTWREHSITWPIGQRLRILLRGLGQTLPEERLAEVIEAHESMEVDIPPDLIDDCDTVLADLSQRFRLAIVSDAIVTPGRRLRDLLAKHRVKQHFTGFAFSDEVGHSKPHRDIFASAADQLGVELSEMVHIGDRDHNDIRGAHAAGMKAVLFVATRDVDRNHSQADAVCERYVDLPRILDQLS